MPHLGDEASNIYYNGAKPSRVICTPRFYQSEGYKPKRDPVYLVRRRRVSCDLHRQTDHYPNSQLRVCKTLVGAQGAKIVWIDLCLKYHSLGCPDPDTDGFPEGFTSSSPLPQWASLYPNVEPTDPSNLTPSVSYDQTCQSTASSPCPSLIDAPVSDDGDDGRYDQRYSKLAAGYEQRYAAAMASSGKDIPELGSMRAVYNAKDIKELSSMLSTLPSPSRQSPTRGEISSNISSQLSAMSSRSTSHAYSRAHSRSSSGSSSFSSVSIPEMSDDMFAMLSQGTVVNPASSQATVVAHASSQAQLTSVLPAVGYEAISPLLGDADPTEAELSAVRTRLNLHSVPHPDSPLLYAVGGIHGRLFENERDAAAAASRRGMFAPTIVFHNHHDKLLDFTFWGAGEGSV
ncbi:hypothetical protein FB45DRAFT_1037053 [Roridomyces roridus]|uniref:Uncharacterized protein n=1 Tax=Roridomyces roridus TaxID=1738132 RepID=A0AAD7B7B6_9AGAR|nr:hypothetical protein FB45DRAFT_1037053 [Roridomyces roridus]